MKVERTTVRNVDVVELTSPVLGARCTLVVGTGDCVVVDPGAALADEVTAEAQARGLVVRAILLTHGHADHTWDAGPLSARLGVPVHVHALDAYRLADPFGTLGALGHEPGGEGALAQVLRRAGVDPASYVPPADLAVFGRTVGASGRSADEVLAFGSVTLVARHAPGHTEGSTIYLAGDTALSGDVLFAGTVGRTDLPGGDDRVMAATLRDVVAALPPTTRVLPGHGPATDIARERHHNPYLR